MPMYHVKCKDCGEEIEESRPMYDGPRKECPKCGGQMHQVWDKAPLMRTGGYSPMHPRALRGRKGRMQGP